MSSILITGSKGLIGTHITELIKASGLEVVELDHAYEASHPGYGSILRPEQISSRIKGCQGVIHLAAVSRVIWGEQDPELCEQTNHIGTCNVLKAVLESPMKPWVIYASSREVYGEQDILPVQEDCRLQPMNVYAHTKVASEEVVNEAQQEGVQTSILRFSNVFGGVEDHLDRVIPAFCWGALEHRLLRIEGSKNVFDFTSIDDVARGVLLVVQHMLENDDSLPPIHFTSGRGTTLREAAEIITQKAVSRSELVEKPPRNFDVSRFYGDPSRARELLGWKSEFTFEEAIDKYLDRLRGEIGKKQEIA